MIKRTTLLLGLALLTLTALAQQKKPVDDLDGLLEGKDKGIRFRLVPADKPEEDLDGRLYWRTFRGSVAASTAPIRFRVGEVDIIAPVLNADAGDGATYSYPTAGVAKLPAGKHLLTPGNIPLEIKAGQPTSDHPAFKIVNGEVRIRCAPVRLEEVDERGVPVAAALRLATDKGSLMREDARFRVLTVWLPVGGTYQSSLGRFTLTSDGKVQARPEDLGKSVQVTPTGLRRTVPAAPTASTEADEAVRLPVPQTGPGPQVYCPLYLPAVVAPGKPLWLAASRGLYRERTGQPFAVEHMKGEVDIGGEMSHKLHFAVGPGPEESQRTAAARALGCPVDDLAWCFAALPQGLSGPLSVRLQSAHTQAAPASVLVAELGQSLQLVPHRWRTVFATTEMALYQVFMPRGSKAITAAVLAHSDKRKNPINLGQIELPAVDSAEFDSRLFELKVGDLPPGQYRLTVETEDARSASVPLTVVSLDRRSPFFAHAMSGCTACWPTSDEGLDLLERAGLEMVAATGARSLLDTALPAVDPRLAARLPGLPAELALKPAGNDRLLERLLRHRLGLIDLTVCRGPSLYMEGLSYHHSYPQTVERMVRHMQVFAQQTADYPSFFGVNYSWFPALYGYAEGGVPTDAHVGDRNRALAEKVQAEGFTPLSKEERDWLAKHRGSADPKNQAELLRLMSQAVAHWKASHDLGWGLHNQRYNDAVRAVRPDLACTLFENAGHNENKRLPAMFNDMNAVCYESYTDFGDWPLSSAFVVDWSKALSPEQPVWLTTCWGASSESKMKSLFHAFARGLDGGGVPMQGTYDLAELERRGTGVRFLSQYGAVAAHATPDGRVALLTRTANLVLTPRSMWDTHAAYCHLTRLGFPPVILSDEHLSEGIPEAVRVLVLVKEQLPWEPATRQAIEAFVKRGGKALTLGECSAPVADVLAVPGPLKNLWQLDGFRPESHQQLWAEFAAWRQPLAAALAKTGLAPRAATDPERGFAVTLDAGPIRYVVVIADAKGTHSNAFEPTTLPLSLDGTGWMVRDLVKQKDLARTEKDGRTETAVELQTAPTTLLALYRRPPGEITLRVNERPRRGGSLTVAASVRYGQTIAPELPLRWMLISSSEEVRTRFGAAEDAVTWSLPAWERFGRWQIEVQELLTGRTARADIEVERPQEPIMTVRPVGPVQVVNPALLRTFAEHPGEKVVIVEPEQPHLLPTARALVEQLQKAGVQARLWVVQPEEYDTHPVRWYPTPPDEQRLKEIEAGRLIGYRQDLQPFIDKIKRAHVPEKGGYAEIEPRFLVGQDCIVFSGGTLAESLRAVSPWLGGPHVPGKGHGRLIACLSPFLADRHTVAVVANDSEGLAKAAAELVTRLTKPTSLEGEKPEILSLDKLPTKGEEVAPVPQPYGNFTPLRLVERLLATDSGRAVAVLRGDKDNVAFIGDDSQVVSTVTLNPELAAYARLDVAGRMHWQIQRTLEKHPGWGFATRVEIVINSVGPDAQSYQRLSAYTGAPTPPGFIGGLLAGAEAEPTALGRPGGLVYRRAAGEFQRFDDVPYAGTRFGILYPRQPVGMTLSPDNRYLLFTMDSRPPFGGLGSPTPRPTACETVLLDLETGQRVWALRGTDDNRPTYAVHTGFAAVARDGEMAALADHDGTVYLVDRAGKVLASEQAVEAGREQGGRLGPPDGVGVRLSDGGETAVFGFTRLLLIGHGGKLVRVPLDGVVSVDVSRDGQRVVAGLADGRVLAFDPTGKPLWTTKLSGAAALVASVQGGNTLAIVGTGELSTLDERGEVVRRTQVIVDAPKVRKEIKLKDDRFAPEYVTPTTLAFAQKHLAAKQVVAWKPAGTGRELTDRLRFYPLPSSAELTAPAEGDYFVHLVYHRPENNKSLRIETEGKDGKETFWLDLPTGFYDYRVVDIPVRGPKAKVTVATDGSAEVAELSLWNFQWPGANLAYVRPAGLEAVNTPKPKGGGDILDDLEGKKPGTSGKLKECRLYWPNTDPDAVRGPFLPVPVDPLQIVDGQRFGGGKLKPWSDTFGNFKPTRGGFFTIDFGEDVTPGLVAVYDRADRQSALAVNLAVFVPDPKDLLRGGRVLTGVVENDQFWRLLPVRVPEKVRQLGVHVIKDANTGSGLSEVEMYRREDAKP